MQSQDDVAADLPRAGRTESASEHDGANGLSWYTPVRFDPGLLRKLLEQHEALERRVASLPARLEHDRDEAIKTAQACAGQLHELRRQEALWVYPLMARHLAADASARSRLMNLRLVMNSLARRVLRSIDELARCVRHAGDTAAAASTVIAALADYRRRNESELYTLYSLMDPRQSTKARVAERV